MKKKMITLSLCCSCLLNAGWYDDAKEKANKAYETTKEYTSEKASNAYETTKEYTSKSYSNVKDKYKNYTKEQKEAHDAKILKCSTDLKEKLPQYALFLEQNYMDVNRKNEAKILKSYKSIKEKGISNKLESSMPKESILKLTSATSSLEYINIVISELKRVEKELKENDSEQLDLLLKQTEYLMYAWTTPLELLSTKKIYENSLLNGSNALYKNINKSNYANYTEFIYSMININLISENIIIQKDSAIKVGLKSYLTFWTLGASLLVTSPTTEDKKGLKSVCEEITDNLIKKDINSYLLENISSTLDIEEEKITKELDKIAKNNNLFEGAKIFNKDIKKLHEVSIVDNPLNDSWYLMLREYMELQDSFYKVKEEVNKVIKILAILPDREKQIAKLKQNLFDVDALYRKFDETVRYNIIDLPVSIYADLYSIELKKAKKWYDDDEKAMGDIAVAYNKACANMQKYMVSEFAINKVMRTTRILKKEFNEDEWKEVKTRAKLTQDWFNMLNKVKINNK